MNIPDNLVVLTFDDGVKSQATFVAPLLKQYGFNATFYITEGLNFLKDKTRYMTWEEVRALSEDGFEIGNHTRRHKNVNDQSPEDLRTDLVHTDPEAFISYMDHLSKNDYTVIALNELVRYINPVQP